MQYNHRMLYRYHPEWGMTFRPNAKIRVASANKLIQSYIVETNSEGFRCKHPFSPPPKELSKIVMATGCSFVAGHGVSNKYRFLDLIEDERDIIVCNVGVSGTGFDQQYLIAESLAHRLRPKVLLLTPYIGCMARCFVRQRDFADPLHGGRTARPKPFFEKHENEWALRNSPVPKWSIEQGGNPLESSRLNPGIIKRINRRLFGEKVAFNDGFSEGRGSELIDFLLSKYVRLAQRTHARLMVCPLPSEFYLKRNNGERCRGFFHEKAKEYGFDYLDILASFQGMTKNERQLLYLPEDGHYSALGHSYLKSILTDWIAAAVES